MYGRFFSLYHNAVSSRVKELAFEDLEANEIVSLLTWVLNTYKRYCAHFYLPRLCVRTCFTGSLQKKTPLSNVCFRLMQIKAAEMRKFRSKRKSWWIAVFFNSIWEKYTNLFVFGTQGKTSINIVLLFNYNTASRCTMQWCLIPFSSIKHVEEVGNKQSLTKFWFLRVFASAWRWWATRSSRPSATSTFWSPCCLRMWSMTCSANMSRLLL